MVDKLPWPIVDSRAVIALLALLWIVGAVGLSRGNLVAAVVFGLAIWLTIGLAYRIARPESMQ